jgi:murein DD-endopeptidase MepM/ murein hydrolase activator NlpD
MNLFIEIKKNWYKNKKEVFNYAKSFVFFTIILSLVIGSFATAQTTDVDQLNSEKVERQKKLDEINRKIKEYTTQISETKKKANTLNNEVLIFDREIASTELQIEGKETQIEDTNQQISELEKLITQKSKEISENKKILAELIRQLHQYDNEFALKTTIAAENLSEFLDEIQYTQNFQDKIYQLVQKIKDLREKLEKQQTELEAQVKTLEELKTQLEISKADLQVQRSQKQTLLTQSRGLESNYQKLLAKSKKEEEDIAKEIEDLDAQIRKKLGQKTISGTKGALAWPLDGVLTQGYGNTGFKALGYSFHNGIDIAGPAGIPIYAVADGEVIYTDSSDQAYGNWVAIKHNIKTSSGSQEIVSLSAHMRSFKVKPGQLVSTGDIIGYEGNTGNTTKKLYGPERGYHIHFGIYDIEGFGVNQGAYSKLYGNYRVPYGYTYNPLNFLE